MSKKEPAVLKLKSVSEVLEEERKFPQTCSNRPRVSDETYWDWVSKVKQVLTLLEFGDITPGEAYDVVWDIGDAILDERIGLNDPAFEKKESPMKRRTFEFVSFDGEFPNYCCGKLVFTYHGNEMTLEGGAKRWLGPFYGYGNEWDILWENIPWEFTDDDKVLFEKMVRDNVEFRCCGGCT